MGLVQAPQRQLEGQMLSKDRDKEKKLMVNMIWVFVAVTVFTGFAAFIIKQFGLFQPLSDAADTEMLSSVQGMDGPLKNPPGDIVDAASSIDVAPAVIQAVFSKPERMRGVFVEPGNDFYSSISVALESLQNQDSSAQQQSPTSIPKFKTDDEAVKKEIDTLVENALNLEMNTLFVRTTTPLGTAYISTSMKSISSFDAFDYLLNQARAEGLYVYAVYDIAFKSDGNSMLHMNQITPDSIAQSMITLGEFASNYAVDGILLEGCNNPVSDESYSQYALYGSGMGFQKYMEQTTRNLITIASETIKSKNPSTQVGLAADAIWATSDQSDDGLPVKSESSDLVDRNLDSRGIIQNGLVDFAAIYSSYSMSDSELPFETATQWWDSIAGTESVPCYMIHDAKKCGEWSDGWNKPDQLVMQAETVNETANLDGSIFDSLNSLVKTARTNANNLKLYYSDDVVTGEISTTTYGSDGLDESKSKEEPKEEPKEESKEPPKEESKEELEQESQEDQEESADDSLVPEETPEPNVPTQSQPEPEPNPQPQPEPEPPKELKALTFIQPNQEKVIVSENSYTFKGTADPSAKLTMDADTIGMDDTGAFTVTVNLKTGDNTFDFAMEEQRKSFTITLEQKELLKDVTPTEALTLDDSKTVEISAVALEGSTVTATINNTEVVLSAQASTDSMGYLTYKGVYTVPESKAEIQDLGIITINASLNQEKQAKKTGKVIIRRKVKPTDEESSNNTPTPTPTPEDTSKPSDSSSTEIEDGQLVKISTKVAWTFPADKLSKYPTATCYPLPYGTMDYVSGDKLTYKDSEGTRTYYMLASGRRVYSDDLKIVSDNISLKDNTISGMTVKATGEYTYVVLKSDMAVSFLPEYTENSFSIDFNYTVSTPDSMNLSQNPLFTAANWNGSKLTLNFKASNGFLGYKAYNQDGNIVFRFNNPVDITGAKIVVDPGHGGSDPGAESSDPNYPEKQINWDVSQQVASALRNLGADVLLLETVNTTTSLDSRFEQGRAFDPHIFISIHSNSSTVKSAIGSEGYYFYPFSQKLANQVATAMASGLDTRKRDTQFDVFYLTRDPQFIGILSEIGFITNNAEYQKMIDPSYQAQIGENVAQTIADFLEVTGSHSGETGTESTGSSTGY